MRQLILFLIAVFLCIEAMAQNTITVTGNITSKDGTPVLASIVVKGSGHGTTTDVRGYYTLDKVPASGALIISAIGYKSLEEMVNNRNAVNVTLDYDAQALDEVIAVAYGTAKKGTFTGSADVLNSKDIENTPVTTFQNAIIGKAAGVQVTSGSGQAGSVASIRIRGIGSMNASNEPLYVIDGAPVAPGSLATTSTLPIM